MLKKRIIPCLDIKEGRTVKGTNFVNLRDAGDPVELAERYDHEGADELVFLDISATLENRNTLTELVHRVAKTVRIPFTVGGGISDENFVYELLQHGADKVCINSAALRNPDLINRIADRFGSQCLVVAIDARQSGNTWFVHTHGGTRPSDTVLFDWAKESQERGAGEILFTSMDHDGTKKGFAVQALHALNQQLEIPVIASGGAGNTAHFVELFEQTGVSAALAVSIFHYREVEIQDLKNILDSHKVPVRKL